jgi:hypothetical protein
VCKHGSWAKQLGNLWRKVTLLSLTMNENNSSVHDRSFRSTNGLETMLESEDSLLFLEGTFSRSLNKGPINIPTHIFRKGWNFYAIYHPSVRTDVWHLTWRTSHTAQFKILIGQDGTRDSLYGIMCSKLVSRHSQDVGVDERDCVANFIT